MRFGRSKARASPPMPLPDVGESVMLSTPSGGRIPARVLERSADSLSVAITVPTRPLTATQLENLVLEYNSPRGRLRLQGTFTQNDPSDPDLLTLLAPRSVEVLQERSYVRIESARPVIMYVGKGGAQMQSFTVDLSGGGFLLAGPDTLTIGEEIRFRLTIKQGEVPITGTARVVRITAQGRRGVSFESISDLDRRRLVRFIFESQRDERHRGVAQRD